MRPIKLYVTNIRKTIFLTEYQFEDTSFVKEFKSLIDKNVGPYDFKTNVKGRMTPFNCFIKNKTLHKLLDECTRFLKITNCRPTELCEAWGNILDRGNEVKPHDHATMEYSALLYLTEGGPGTYFHGFDITIEEKIGKIVFFSSEALHSVKGTTKKQKRYTLALNFVERAEWHTIK